MPDRRKHRGAHPADKQLFAVESHARLREAVSELSWLLTRGYNETSALKLVGDRHALTARQRTAVRRCSCSDEQLSSRRTRRVDPANLTGIPIAIDGFNLLIILESALSGGVVLRGSDGCYRDLASVHGTYRTVSETGAAVRMLGEVLDELGVRDVAWYLDQPVSNSGRLKLLLCRIAEERGWSWTVELHPNPDRLLSESTRIVATSDSGILDCGPRWFDAAGEVIRRRVPHAWCVELRPRVA